MFKKAWEREEIKEKLTPTGKTARELKKIYESVHSELKFEMETCEDFESGTLPTLDYQCWLQEDKLHYKFFMKPMAKRTVILKSSALGENKEHQGRGPDTGGGPPLKEHQRVRGHGDQMPDRRQFL